MKLRSENFETAKGTAINTVVDLSAYEVAGYYQYLPQERAPFFAFSMKLVLIRNKCYRCKLVCTSTMNEWCKILQDINDKNFNGS